MIWTNGSRSLVALVFVGTLVACRTAADADPAASGEIAQTGCGGPATAPCPAAECTVGDGCRAVDCRQAASGLPNQCAGGVTCAADTDCQSGRCVEGTCAGANADPRGERNAKSSDGAACADATDCASGDCQSGLCVPASPTDGVQGDEMTDAGCGGKLAPACDWGKRCRVDADCTSRACGADHTCLEGPSCKTLHGGTTCGLGEFDDPNKRHESCCRSLHVEGFSDARQPGKSVYLDKYEITAGRMREFLTAVVAGGEPDVKGYMAAHRPARWNPGWEDVLPAGNRSSWTFTVTNPTTNPLYPGQDVYAQSGVRDGLSILSGQYTLSTGVFDALGAHHMFPEWYAAPPLPAPDIAATHNLNCSNEVGSFGRGTYWFDPVTIQSVGGGVGKTFSREQMDEKALNCTPFALFAAFCAWDGGQLATSDVIDYVATGRVPPVGDCVDGINATLDSQRSCPEIYEYPDAGAATNDGSGRIAPPGRIAADTLRLQPGDEPWMDIRGNLIEAILAPNDTFYLRGGGLGYVSTNFNPHPFQALLPRMKSGSLGARCMRFK